MRSCACVPLPVWLGGGGRSPPWCGRRGPALGTPLLLLLLLLTPATRVAHTERERESAVREGVEGAAGSGSKNGGHGPWNAHGGPTCRNMIMSWKSMAMRSLLQCTRKEPHA